MTIREEYKEMKRELRKCNEATNWDGTQHTYEIGYSSKKARTEFVKLLNKDFEDRRIDLELNVIDMKEYDKRYKVWADRMTSVMNMKVC